MTEAHTEWIDPLADIRWSELVEHHPRASVFHTRQWLEALKRSYGYEPVALVVSRPKRDLVGGMVFCNVRSWVTGRRLVSLPFSDHCDPLVSGDEQAHLLLDILRRRQSRGQWRYIEYRPSAAMSAGDGAFGVSCRYYLHRLDLTPDLQSISNTFHKSHVSRKIRRSERENLRYEEGNSEHLLGCFYRLLLGTRRRHGLPPQPIKWFRSLMQSMHSYATVRVAFKGQIPIASMLTIRYRDTMVYKYGASDSEYHPLGGMHLLFWRTIQDARGMGCVTLDFGRSEPENEGLIAFKEHWGCVRSPLLYWRTPSPGVTVRNQPRTGLGQRIVSFVPDRMLVAVGNLLYPHVG